MNKEVIAVVFARGGSKGVPRKNVHMLAGKPLIAHTIVVGQACALVDRVVVSTDDQEIADVAREYGAEVPFIRPEELARDDTPELLAWRHAVQALRESHEYGEPEILVSIPATSPLRIPEDVDNCISMLRSGDADIVITVKPASRNPYFNMVVLDKKSVARRVIEPKKSLMNRQSAPEVFDMTTVAYAARPDFVMRAESVFDGKVAALVVPEERAMDIDTELDFRVAEALMTQERG